MIDKFKKKFSRLFEIVERGKTLIEFILLIETILRRFSFLKSIVMLAYFSWNFAVLVSGVLLFIIANVP
jgi:hypothetical protein